MMFLTLLLVGLAERMDATGARRDRVRRRALEGRLLRTDTVEVLLFLRHASRLLWEARPEWVEGGCADVSGTLAEVCRRLGVEGVSVAHGRAWMGKPSSGRCLPHVWLDVHGMAFDPVLWVQGRSARSLEPDPSMAFLLRGSCADRNPDPVTLEEIEAAVDFLLDQLRA